MNRKLETCFYLLLGTLYVYSITLAIVSTTVIAVTDAFMLLAGFFWLTLFALIFYNRYTFFGFLIVFSVAAMLLWWRLPNVLGAEEGFLYEAFALVETLILFFGGNIPFAADMGTSVIVVIIFVVALYTALSLYVVFHFYFLGILGLAVYFFSSVAGYPINHVSFICFTVCFLAFLIKKMNLTAHNRRKVHGRLLHNTFGLKIIPACVGLTLVAATLPTVALGDDSPREWSAAGIEAQVLDFFYPFFNPKFFDFQTTGFSGRGGRLGGDVLVNDREVMWVRNNRRVYLSGAVRDIYTGEGWLASRPEHIPFDVGMLSADAFKTKNALLTQMRDEVELTEDNTIVLVADGSVIGALEEVTVNIDRNRIATIFQPAKMVYIGINQPVTFMQNGMGALSTTEFMPALTEYVFQYLWVDYSNSAVQDLLRQQPPPGQARELPATYIELPPSVPQRVINLAHEVAGHYDNNFDKVKALEAFLARGFEYTLTPGPVPYGHDFVDYFLFEVQVGYCTYYATALAVLSRALGIPSRYLEGFSMPMHQIDYHYHVTNRYAHAWVEIYFEGFGWVPFEPTSAHHDSFYGRDIYHMNNVNLGWSDFWHYYDIFDDFDVAPMMHLLDTDYISTEAQRDTMRLRLIILAVILALCLPVALLVGVRIMAEKIYFYRLKKKPISAQVEAYFKGILKMAQFQNHTILPSETIGQYAARTGNSALKDMVSIYYKSKYCENGVNQNDLAIIKFAYFDQLQNKRLCLSKAKFCFVRYVTKRF